MDEDNEVWLILAIFSGIVLLICVCGMVYVEYCRNAPRKYERVAEMMERRKMHIARGDHDKWDV